MTKWRTILGWVLAVAAGVLAGELAGWVLFGDLPFSSTRVSTSVTVSVLVVWGILMQGKKRHVG